MTTTPNHNNYAWGRRTVQPNEPFVVHLQRNDFDYLTCPPPPPLSTDATTTTTTTTTTNVYENRFGRFEKSAVVHQSFGSKWIAKSNNNLGKGEIRRKLKAKQGETTTTTTKSTTPSGRTGHVYLLPVTPENWTRALRHRTQIIYSLDAALITYHLDLVPGSVVVESGTGSGSLSFHFARAVAPTGRVLTYEFNRVRVEEAKKDFALLNVSDLVTVTHADASAPTGFAGCDHAADAVFYDLPAPWKAVDNAIRALREDKQTRLCSFSPCSEQVQKMCEELGRSGFTEIRTFECVSREILRSSFPRCQAPFPRIWNEQEEEGKGNGVVSSSSSSENEGKHARVDEESNGDDGEEAGDANVEIKTEEHAVSDAATKPIGNQDRKWKNESEFATWSGTMNTHTGYLTFATLLPKHMRSPTAPNAVESSTSTS